MPMYPTGSRHYGTAKPESDYDYLVFYEDKTMDEIKAYYETTDYIECGSESYGKGNDRYIVRDLKTNVNLIILTDKDKYDQRVMLADFCKMIKANKATAYALHNAAFPD